MKWLTVLVALHLYLLTSARQTTIEGSVQSPEGKGLPNVTVLLKDKNGLVLQFTRSNAEGKFTFSLRDTLYIKVALLELNHVGFEMIREPLQSGQRQYRFQLKPLYRELSNVKIKNRPEIISKGDTLSYPVKSFARQEDRSIGDVLKRLPGVTVDEDGRIYYNDKLIDNLYTDGDNLMDGRYGLATKVISKELIQSIDIIQHHQAIEALRGKVNSDKVAVNLVLKDDHKVSLSTQANLAAGLPAQYDASISTVLLNKKIKLLEAVRFNNSGVDYRGDFSQLGSTSMLNEINVTNPGLLLSSGTVSNPDLPRRNYYLNRSSITNLNQLFKNNQGTQFRLNLQAFSDRQTLRYENATNLQLNGDTANYRERQRAVTKLKLAQAAFGLLSNKSSYFIENKLSAQWQQEEANSSLSTDRIAFNQQLNTRKYLIRNDFSIIPALKSSSILELRWLLNYSNQPQTLLADTGLHQGLLNQDQPFQETRQQASVPVFYSDFSAAFQWRRGLIQQNYRTGLVTERQQLNSRLQLRQLSGQLTDYTGDAGNALRWRRDRFFVQADYSINLPRYEIGLTIPLISQRINYQQIDYALDKTQRQLFLNPSARFKWMVNREDYLTLNYAYNNNPGDITGVYRGLLLSNYRALQASDADLQQTYRSNASFYYSFQRAISMLFMSAGIQYNSSRANFLYSSIITDSIQRIVLLPYKNSTENISLSGSFSKYLFSMGGTLSVKFVYRQGRHNQLVNAMLLPYGNTSLSIMPSWQGRLFRKINFAYEAAWQRSGSFQKSNKDIGTNMRRIDQQLSLHFSLLKNLLLHTKARHIHSKQSGWRAVNYVFADINLRYHYSKWKTDVELDCSNLMGIKTYEIFRVDANIASQNRYLIRGRMIMLRTIFNF